MRMSRELQVPRRLQRSYVRLSFDGPRGVAAALISGHRGPGFRGIPVTSSGRNQRAALCPCFPLGTFWLCSHYLMFIRWHESAPSVELEDRDAVQVAVASTDSLEGTWWRLRESALRPVTILETRHADVATRTSRS